jgi:colicin import membrane protein
MESLAYLDQRLPRRDIAKGFGTSVLVHILLFTAALAGPWGLPRRSLQESVATVSLVSLQDIGLAPAPLQKGSKSATGEGFRGPETPKAVSSPQSKATPFVPVKRLQVRDATTPPQAELKKLDAPDIPKIPEKSQPSASIDKDIEKLIPKPKAQPKPTPQPSAAAPAKGAQLAAVEEKDGERNPKAAQEGPAKGAPEGVGKGHPEGSPKGVAEGAGKGAGGSGASGGEGGRVASSLLGFYGDRVKETISRNWVFSEAIRTQGLETRVMVVINREGGIMELRVEKSSGNTIFDESAIRAVRKSAPLPPLPQVISYPKVEISLRFSPEGLS